MKRKEQRLLKKLEKEPVKGLNNTQKHFYADLQNRLNAVDDPRDNRYTTYSCATLLGMGLVKNLCGITSMQRMTAVFTMRTVFRTFLPLLAIIMKNFLIMLL